MPDDVCANCMCELISDCCGEARAYVVDDIAYCCEACAEDGVCDCGCVASWAESTASAATSPGPSVAERP